MEFNYSYTKPHIEEIRCELQKRLSPRRFEHTVRVAKTAVLFAERTGFDVTRAEVAALLHDVAREFTDEEFSEAIEKYQVKLNRFNRNFKPSIHGPVGAAIARQDFGIQDDEILRAISNHVSGRPCMRPLEKIVYLSDHIDRLESFRPETVAATLSEPLDEALYHILGYVIEYDTKAKKQIDERTLQTFDWMIEQMNDEPLEGAPDFSDEKFDAFFDKMDGLLDLYSEHALLDYPAENMRDLGGYPAIDGRALRKNMILRSGNPDRFTFEDFKGLSASGINYMIDLREDFEKEQTYDMTGTGMQCIDIPLSSIGECKSYLEMLLDWIIECDDPEESAWLTALYFDAFELDSLYLKVLLDPHIQEKYREILDIMLRDDCTGIWIFCNKGKDRTSIMTTMVMHVLGIDITETIDDYMSSCVPYYAITLKYLNQLSRQGYGRDILEKVVSVLGVEYDRPLRLNQKILTKFKDYRDYFDIDDYFNPDDLKRFRDKYLE